MKDVFQSVVPEDKAHLANAEITVLAAESTRATRLLVTKDAAKEPS